MCCPLCCPMSCLAQHATASNMPQLMRQHMHHWSKTARPRPSPHTHTTVLATSASRSRDRAGADARRKAGQREGRQREAVGTGRQTDRQTPDLYGPMPKTRQLMLPGNGEKPVAAPPVSPWLLGYRYLTVLPCFPLLPLPHSAAPTSLSCLPCLPLLPSLPHCSHQALAAHTTRSQRCFFYARARMGRR